jgi:hypothetical protein
MAEYIEFHIEISSLIHFVNEQIELNIPLPINKEVIFQCFKSAVINSETKPFLLAKVANEDNLYYEKYVRLEYEFQDKYIPDFFSYNGDFYDLDANLNISRRNTNDIVFKQLFLIKMLELNSARVSLPNFLNFQLYDNFYGDTEGLASFLIRLTGNNINPYLLPLLSGPINKWINDNGQNDAFNLILNEEQNITEEEDVLRINLDSNGSIKKDEEFYATKRNFKIQGHFTDDEIRHYFSFLYLEKGADKQPFLNEEAFKQIFANGLLIPQEPSRQLLILPFIN